MALAQIDNSQLPDGFTLDTAPTPAQAKPKEKAAISSNAALPDGFTLDAAQPTQPTGPRQLPPMSRAEADAYLQNLATGGQGTFKPSKSPSFAQTALVDPESPVFGEPIKSAIHPDTRNGRNLVPVQDVAAVRQQMQYDAANPDVAARIARSQQMDTSLPLAQRLAARQGLQARTRTEFGQSVSNVNDQYLNYVGNTAANAGESFAQFMAKNFQTENPQATPGEIGAARSVAKNVARTVADPTTQAALLTGGVGGKLGQVAVSSLFAAGAAKGSYDAAGQLGSIWDRPDISSQQKAEMSTDLVLNTAMAGLAGGHAVKAGLLTPSDTMLSGLSPEAKLAITRRVNDAINKTGGVLSKAASTAGDVMAEVGNSDRENVDVPDPRQVVTQRVVDAAPKVGVKLNTADNALQAIRQARADTLAHHEHLAGGNLGDIAQPQADSMNTELDLLNTMEDHIHAGRDAAQKNANNVPQTRPQALMSLLKGAAKAAAVHGAISGAESLVPGVSLNPVIPMALELAGISSFGGPQIAKGIKGIIGKRPVTPDVHDAIVQKMFSGFSPSTEAPTQAADMPSGPDPFAAQPATATDTSVQHTSNIAPPLAGTGEAQTYPDLPIQFNVSSGSTANPADLIQRLKAVGNARAQTNSPVQTSTAFPANVTPQLEPRQLNLAPSAQPGTMSIQDIQNAAREATARQAPGTVEVRNATPQPNAVDVKAAQTMNTDYLGRHGSALEQARAEWQAANPGQPVPAWDSGIMQRAGEIDARMRQGSSLTQEQPPNGFTQGPLPDRFKPIVLNQPGDIFPNDQAMQDWLDKMENSNPALQRVKDLAKQRIQQGDLPEGLRPSPEQQAKNDAQIQQMIQEVKYGPQGVDTPAALDAIDQWIRRTNVQPKPFQAGRPLKTIQPPLEGQDLIDGLLSMKAKSDAARAAAQAAAPGTATTVPPVQQGATLDAVREALSKPPDPTSASAAQLSMLRNELVRTTDPAQRIGIQQAIDHLQAVTTGKPFSVTDQATAENLPYSQPREIEPGTYNRETKTTTPATGTVMVPLKDISVKPKLMQFRTDVDPVTGIQAGRSIEGVKFDQDLAGPVLLWKDPTTGETILADGHHRYDLAQASGTEKIEGRYMNVPTVKAARARAAFTNIAQGNASLFDAAKFFRDSGITPEQLAQKNISLSAGIAQKALSLSRLDDSIFEKVRSKRISENQGAIIGEATDDPAIQESIVKEMQSREDRGRSVTDANVAELARLAKLAGTKTETTMDLFGGQQQSTGLLGEFADVVAQARKDLVSQKSTFGAVAKEGRAQTLSSVQGQTIIPAENARLSQQAAQQLELLNKLSTSPGPIHDMLMQAAKNMAGSDPRKARLIRESTSQAVREELGKIVGGTGPTSPEGGQNVIRY